MKAVELLRLEAEMAHTDLLEVLAGVTQKQSWAVLPKNGSDYLNTDGSIHGVTLHIACCKQLYGSMAFRNGEVRWRDCAERMDKFEPSWPAAMEYMAESQAYWMQTWESLADEDLEKKVTHFSGRLWPTWKIIRMVTYHDAYHTGQIAVFRYGSPESVIAPPSCAADLRNCCPGLPSW